ncbi:hypothetical protein KO481_33030 [Nocardia sp. NEAU-G5]|uniref:Uncharacterized protein n=1 Tax=Nocardia albiluteola TaxID=2842303 RepID=A0ABS6B9B3_9NOCA|nr:hypothetical protein [Nocardia albiluteola]MBU3066331.1 hypothetical protein [Nocardia albiluteola]
MARVVLAVVIIPSILIFGYHRFEAWRNPPSQTWHLANSITVKGFNRLTVIDDPVDAPMAEAYFIGPPPKPDPLAVVTVPTIQLATSPRPDLGRPHDTRSVVTAGGFRPDGCGAIVSYDSDPRPTVGLMEDEHHISILTKQQITDVLNGTKVFIEVVVSDCGW